MNRNGYVDKSACLSPHTHYKKSNIVSILNILSISETTFFEILQVKWVRNLLRILIKDIRLNSTTVINNHKNINQN